MADKNKGPSKRSGDYVRKVTEEAQSFMKDLKTENEKLRGTVATLQSENATLAGELGEYRIQQAALAVQLASISKDGDRASQRYVGLEQQITTLSNLFVASYRLHETLERGNLIAIIKDILANIIGSEEVAIYEVNPSENTLVLIGSAGMDEKNLQTVRIGEGLIGRAAETGEIYMGGDATSADVSTPSACIPIKFNGQVTGLIAIFRMLPQKPVFVAVDTEVMELLATQTGMALYCSKLQARIAKSHSA